MKRHEPLEAVDGYLHKICTRASQSIFQNGQGTFHKVPTPEETLRPPDACSGRESQFPSGHRSVNGLSPVHILTTLIGLSGLWKEGLKK